MRSNELLMVIGRWKRLSCLQKNHAKTTLFGAGQQARDSLQPSFATSRCSTIAHFTTTATKDCGKKENDNDTTIEAVFCFHRHGDRTPGKPLVAEDQARDEAAFWRTKIPPKSYHTLLCERFPIVKGGKSDVPFKDASGGNESYGFLTQKGMDQMYRVGVAMANRYGDSSSSTDASTSSSFRENWEIRSCRSTNYLRTVWSCQAFLFGLLTTEQHQVNKSENEPSMPLTNLGRSTSNHNDQDGAFGVVDIAVMPALNAFDASPQLLKKLVTDVWATADFIEMDQRGRPLAEELIKYIPGLLQHSSSSTSPSGGVSINWIHASDHFVCRSSHDVPIDRFCPHLLRKEEGINSDEKNRQIQSLVFNRLKEETLSHLSRRFHGYYSNQALLGEIAGPALWEVIQEMKCIAMGSHEEAKHTKKPFYVYSCHDVTILALLYAIQNNHSVRNGQIIPPNWPTYATCLVLELVKKRKSTDATTIRSRSQSTFVVKAYLHSTVPQQTTTQIVFAKDSHKKFNSPSLEINLEEFIDLVQKLNASRVAVEDIE